MEDLYESSHLYACTSQKYIMTNDGSIVEYEMIKNLVNTLPREVKGPTCKAKHFLTAHTHALPPFILFLLYFKHGSIKRVVCGFDFEKILYVISAT